MHNVRQLGDLRLRGGIAPKLVCDDLAWYFATRGKYACEEALRCSLVATFLKQDVEFGAALINRTPQQVWFAAQRYEHLIEAPGRAWFAAAGFHAMRKARAKLTTPVANRSVADDPAAFEQQFFNIA